MIDYRAHINKNLLFDIPESDIKSGVVALTGALAGFLTQRFYKNKDSDRERIRALESESVKLSGMVSSLIQLRETDVKNIDNMQSYIIELRNYISKSHHSLTKLINERTLKDSVIDKLYEDMERFKNEKR